MIPLILRKPWKHLYHLKLVSWKVAKPFVPNCVNLTLFGPQCGLLSHEEKGAWRLVLMQLSWNISHVGVTDLTQNGNFGMADRLRMHDWVEENHAVRPSKPPKALTPAPIGPSSDKGGCPSTARRRRAIYQIFPLSIPLACQLSRYVLIGSLWRPQQTRGADPPFARLMFVCSVLRDMDAGLQSDRSSPPTNAQTPGLFANVGHVFDARFSRSQYVSPRHHTWKAVLKHPHSAQEAIPARPARLLPGGPSPMLAVPRCPGRIVFEPLSKTSASSQNVRPQPATPVASRG